jgi:hypothetical protein
MDKHGEFWMILRHPRISECVFGGNDETKQTDYFVLLTHDAAPLGNAIATFQGYVFSSSSGVDVAHSSWKFCFEVGAGDAVT